MEVITVHNQIDHILLTEEQISNRVKELAVQLSCDYAGKNPIFVGVIPTRVMNILKFSIPTKLE